MSLERRIIRVLSSSSTQVKRQVKKIISEYNTTLKTEKSKASTKASKNEKPKSTGETNAKSITKDNKS